MMKKCFALRADPNGFFERTRKTPQALRFSACNAAEAIKLAYKRGIKCVRDSRLICWLC